MFNKKTLSNKGLFYYGECMTQIIFEYGLMADIDDDRILERLSNMAVVVSRKAEQYSSGFYKKGDFTPLTCDDFHVTILRNSVLQKILDGFEISPDIRKKTLERLKTHTIPDIVFSDKIGYVKVEKKDEVKASLFMGLDNQDEWRSYLLDSLSCLKLSFNFKAQSFDKKRLKSIDDFEGFISSKSDDTPYFHISLANISNGNPYKSVGNVSRRVARQNKLI